jgi:hypothetical protein
VLPQRPPAGRVVEAPERRVVARPPDEHDLVVTVPACGDLPGDPLDTGRQVGLTRVVQVDDHAPAHDLDPCRAIPVD